jgi:hypothetical protein
MLIKPHMCHITYAIHIYVIRDGVNQARFTKFILGLCHLNQVCFILGLDVYTSFHVIINLLMIWGSFI